MWRITCCYRIPAPRSNILSEVSASSHSVIYYRYSRDIYSCPVQLRACHWDCVFSHNFSGKKRTCWTTDSWRCCLRLEVVSSIPTGSTMIYRLLCGSICVFLYQSIKINPTNMYRQIQVEVQNQHTQVVRLTHAHSRRVVSCPVQHRACHWDCVLTQFQWQEANVLDNWQLAVLSQVGGSDFDHRWVHDNLSVP